MTNLRIFTNCMLAACLLTVRFPSFALAVEGKACANPATSADLIECAFANDPKVLEARADLEQARAVRSEAGLWSNPGLDAEALYPPRGGNGYKSSVGLLQSLAITGWRGHAVRAADFRISAARVRLEAVRWQVAAEVVIGLVRLRQVAHESRLVKEAGKLCDLAMEKSGKLAFLTDEQATARQAFLWRREAIRSRARLLENEELEVKERLAVSIGGQAPRERDFPIPFREEWPRWPVSEGSTPAIAGLRAEADAARADMARARAESLPDISVGPYFETEPGQGASGVSRDWGARISLTLPLFDRNQGGISAAAAGRRKAEASLAAMESAVAGRIKSLERRYQRSVERLLEYGMSLRQGEGLIEDVKSRYLSGRVSASVVLEVLGSYQEAVEEAHGLERETYATFWEGCYLSGMKEIPKP